MGLTAAVAMGLAVWRILGPVAAMGLLVIGLAMLGHIAGNAIGSQLRDGTTERLRRKPRNTDSTTDSNHPSAAHTIKPGQFAPVTQLSRRKPLGWFMILGTALSAVVGGVLGGALMVRQNPEGATLLGLSIGCIATGLLGGLWGFWCCSLAQVIFGAWREATKGHR